MDNDANKKLNDLFDKAKSQPSKVSFEEAKEQFLNTIANQQVTKGKDFTQFFNLKNIIMIASIITTIALVWVYQPENVKKQSVHQLEVMPTKTTTWIETEKQVVKEQEEVATAYLGKVDRLNPQPLPLKTEKKEPIRVPADHLKNYKKVLVESSRDVELLDTGYRFPKLTQQEIIENSKQKAKMVKQLDKLDKKQYAFIPSGTFKTGDKNWSVHAFYMQTTEVSNLEYRTFLFDLLINNRKEEFLAAKPDQSRWVKDYANNANKQMEEQYFSHTAYNDYPVVAISRKGVEMYCKWLTEEANRGRKKGNFINDVRLPSNYEWMYAASGGKDNQPYPWDGAYVKNSKGCYLANFKPGISKIRPCESTLNKLENTTNKDSLSNYVRTADNVIVPRESNDLYSADGGFYTVKVSCYNPNDFGLYCMSGNVAEMVLNNNGKLVAKGGGWNSIDQQLQIEADNDFDNVGEPSTEIGFRPVITFLDGRKPLVGVLGKTTSDLPPGTVQISNELYFDKTEISNFSWKEYVFWQAKTYGENSKEYKDALPDTTVSVWNDLNVAYRTHYYNHPSYNNYPVVGVSYNQAVAFCKWRTERVKQLYKINNEIGSDFEYRLPTEAEWENIAKAGYSSINTKKDGDKHKFNLKRSQEDFKDTAKLNENADVTAPIESYWPNNFGVYNIIGNVAEMVQEKGIAKGGSWIHTAEEANLENEIPYNKPERWLGFRCVAEISQ